MTTMIESKKIQQARTEVAQVLRRYRVEWDDVAPDADLFVWKEVEPVARRARQDLFKKRYPGIHAKNKQPRKV